MDVPLRLFRNYNMGLEYRKLFEFFFLNWDSFHSRLNSHYEAGSCKKKKYKKIKYIQEICFERTYW